MCEEAEKLGVMLSTLHALVALHDPPVLQAKGRVLFDQVAHDALKEAMRRCREV